jgi:sec-independent protein translocase protein TatB
MFDIGFWELSLIGIVALLVIGPERLPAVARTAGKWMGRANRFISNIKDDINKEIKDEELKKILSEQQKLAEDFKNAANTTQSSINSGLESVNKSTHIDDLIDFEDDNRTEKKPHASASQAEITSTKNNSSS